MNRSPEYIQTKINLCTNPPFKGLGALGLWYSYCIESEINKWSYDCSRVHLGAAQDMAAFTIHPSGFHIRRVLSDGKLLKVYDDRNVILDDTLIPIAVPGKNLQLLELEQVVTFLKKKGAYYCRFAVRGLTHTGYVLDGTAYCAAWSDDQRGFLFETEAGKNPNNSKVIEKLSECAV
jgi:hypothetical protein